MSASTSKKAPRFAIGDPEMLRRADKIVLLIDPAQVIFSNLRDEFLQAYERLEKLRPVFCLSVRQDMYMRSQFNFCSRYCSGGVFLNAVWRSEQIGGTGKAEMTEANLFVTDNLARVKKACVRWHANKKLVFVYIGNFYGHQSPADDEIFTDTNVTALKTVNDICKFLKKADKKAGAS